MSIAINATKWQPFKLSVHHGTLDRSPGHIYFFYLQIFPFTGCLWDTHNPFMISFASLYAQIPAVTLYNMKFKVWYLYHIQPTSLFSSGRIQHTVTHIIQVCRQLEPLRHNSCPPGTQHCWVDRAIEWEVCPTLLHMTNDENRTPGLFILSPMPYPLGHMLPHGESASCSFTSNIIRVFPIEHGDDLATHPTETMDSSTARPHTSG